MSVIVFTHHLLAKSSFGEKPIGKKLFLAKSLAASFDRFLTLAHSHLLTPRLWSQLQQQVLTDAEVKASRPGAHRFVADGTTGLARRPGAHRLLVGDAITRRPVAHRLL